MNYSEFEIRWIEKINNNLLKFFPKDFLGDYSTNTLRLPGKPLLKGSELFGSFEITDVEGTTILNTSSKYKLKYILYANRKYPYDILIPSNESEIKTVVINYEKHLDDLFTAVQTDFKEEFNSTKEMTNIITRVFRKLNLHRY